MQKWLAVAAVSLAIGYGTQWVTRQVLNLGTSAQRAEITQRQLAEAAAELNRPLPMAVGDDTEAFSITALPNLTLLYSYRLTSTTLTPDLKREAIRYLQGDLRRMMSNFVCSTPDTREMLDAGVTMRYDYYDAHMTFIGMLTFTQSDCPRR